MEIYRDNSAVTVTIQYKNTLERQITPVSASYSLLDQDNQSLLEDVQIDLGATSTVAAIITVPAQYNLLGGERRILRTIVLKFSDSLGNVYEVIRRYMVEKSITLDLMVNTYQTYNNALITAREISNIDSWETSSDEEKQKALIDAYERLGKMSYSIDYDDDLQSRINTTHRVRFLNDLTVEQFNALPPKFLSAIKKAQIVEADVILGGDSLSDSRRNGLIQETVGESTTVFRVGKPVSLVVSPKTLIYLQGYVLWGLKVSRSS